jgi:hypothetical protein
MFRASTQYVRFVRESGSESIGKKDLEFRMQEKKGCTFPEEHPRTTSPTEQLYRER